MNLYEDIKENLQDMREVESNQVETLEEAYEKFYYINTHLEDMDDLGNLDLQNIKENVEKGRSFKDSLVNVLLIKNGLKPTSDHFVDTLDYYGDKIEDIFNKVNKESNPAKEWNTEITYLRNAGVYTFDGEEYTLKKLREKVEREVI